MHHDRIRDADSPPPRDKTSGPAVLATDLESRRLAREARACLEQVLVDLCELESALARFQAWLAVPPEFRRAGNRVA